MRLMLYERKKVRLFRITGQAHFFVIYFSGAEDAMAASTLFYIRV